MRAVIAAAGTGGHINPGIAIANKIMEKEPNSEIVFIGTGRGLEKDLVPRAGYKLETIDAYGINRKINIDNVKRLYKTIKSIGQAKEILRRFRSDDIGKATLDANVNQCDEAQRILEKAVEQARNTNKRECESHGE